MSAPRVAERGVPRRQLAALLMIGLVQAAGVAGLVLLIRLAVDRLQATPFDGSSMVPVLGGLVAVALMISGARAAEYAVSEHIGFDYVQRLRMQMYDHLLGMTPRQVAGRSRGGVVLRFTGDLSTLRTWVSRGLARGIVALIVLAGGIATVAALNLRLGAALAGVLLIGSAFTIRQGVELQRRTRSMRRRRSLLTSNLVEQIGALGVVQAFGRSQGERSRLDKHNTSMTDGLKKVANTRARLRGIASLTALAALVIVVAVGVAEVDRGRSDVAEVVAVITAIRYLSGPVRTLGLSHDYWQSAQVSRAKINDFFRAPAASPHDPDLARLRVKDGSVEVRGLRVDGALADVDLEVPGRTMLAVTGPNGAGKSTLLSVVSRLVDADAGEVLIDGQPLSGVSRRSVQRNVGIVSADLPLMSGTVRRNLTYRYRDAGEDEIERVMHACHIEEVLETLPSGLDSWLREGGQNLSLGHRQRIALGRAILGNPAILLLDEPTSNLDDASKEVFRRVLASHGGTVILATHDPVEASLADWVVRLEHGSVVDVVSGAEYRLLRHQEDEQRQPLDRW